MKILLDDKQVKALFRTMEVKLPKDINKFMVDFLTETGNQVKKNAYRKVRKFEGGIKTIGVRQEGNSYTLVAPKSALFVDAEWSGYNKGPRWVNTDEAPKLKRWVEKSPYSKWRNKRVKPKWVIVKSHPFIRMPIEKEFAKMTVKLDRAVTQSLKK